MQKSTSIPMLQHLLKPLLSLLLRYFQFRSLPPVLLSMLKMVIHHPLLCFFVLDSLLNVFLIAQGRFLQVRKLHRIVKRIPVPTRSTSITGPHTKASTSDMILLNIYYLSSLILFSFLKYKKGATKIRCSFNL